MAACSSSPAGLIRGGLVKPRSGMLNGQRDGGNFNNQWGGVGGVGGAPLNGQTLEGSMS